MHTFFHGWRRKAGVVTLVLACLLTSLWVRSLSIADEINVDRYGYMYALESKAGDICCLRWTGWVGGTVTWQTSPHRDGGAHSFDGVHRFSAGTNFGPDLSHVGETGIYPPDRRATGQGFRISYSAFVLPLTLLSAYLILWKPRTRVTRSP